jgi:hypothetical protein
MKVQFLSFPDCPNRAVAKSRLTKVLADLRLPVEVEEIDTALPATPEHLKGWPSPTILINGKDIEGLTPGTCESCRRYADGQAPSEATLRAALRRATNAESAQGLFGGAPAVLASLLPALARPACIGPLAGLLSAFGIGFIFFAKFFLVTFGLAFLIGLVTVVRATRRHHNPWPLALTVLGGLAVLGGRLLAQQESIQRLGFPLLLGGSLLSFWLLRRTRRTSLLRWIRRWRSSPTNGSGSSMTGRI